MALGSKKLIVSNRYVMRKLVDFWAEAVGEVENFRFFRSFQSGWREPSHDV